MARDRTPDEGKSNKNHQPKVEGSKRKRYANDDERRAAKREQSRSYYARKNEALKKKGTTYSKERRATSKRVDKIFAKTKKGTPKGALAKTWWNASLGGFDYENKKQARDFTKTYDATRKMRRRKGESAGNLNRRKAEKWAQLAKKHKLKMNQTSDFIRMMMSG